MAYNDIMKTMLKRTTISLDEATVNKLQQLSQLWGVSQAEVVRRAIDSAEKSSSHPLSLVENLTAYWEKGGLDPNSVDKFLQEWTADRDSWRGQ